MPHRSAKDLSASATLRTPHLPGRDTPKYSKGKGKARCARPPYDKFALPVSFLLSAPFFQRLLASASRRQYFVERRILPQSLPQRIFRKRRVRAIILLHRRLQ